MDIKKLWKTMGSLGFVLVLLAMAWWMALVASLPRGHREDEALKYVISCLYSSSDICAATWYFAKTSLPAYTPVPLWIGLVLLTISTVLRSSAKPSQPSQPPRVEWK